MTTDQVINKYLAFGGERDQTDFGEFLKQANQAKLKHKMGTKDYILIEYVENKLIKGLSLCIQYGSIFAIIDEQSREDIEAILKDAGYLSGNKPTNKKTSPKKKAPKKSAKKKPAKKSPKKGTGDLGKIVDHGEVAPHGNSDAHWRKQGVEMVFKANDPKVRSGLKIPDSYEYANVRYLEKFYTLKAIEFGNWLSQQDRINYLTGLGLALFDLHKAIGFKPEQISINGKISVAFGARGRGRATAHFEPGSFAINLTRYSRPAEVKARPTNFNRVDLILKDGGVGSFAHEYGHALDYYGGLHIEKGDTFGLSRDDNTDPRPDMALMKKKTLRGLMEKLLFRICWKTEHNRSAYYNRLSQAVSTDYYFQRNEIFARAFEVYVHFKLEKAKYHNVFLHKTKYRKGVYLSYNEMKALEKDFDALINALKRHFKTSEH